MDAMRNTDLVIEAVVENLDIKHKLFATIDRVSNVQIYFIITTLFHDHHL